MDTALDIFNSLLDGKLGSIKDLKEKKEWTKRKMITIKNNKYVRGLVILIFLTPCLSATSNKFKLLTTLYNEKKEKRCLEFKECIKINLKHSLIDTVHVLYDTSQDEKREGKLLKFLLSKKVKISYISGRPTFGQFFEIANNNYPDSKIIISNADIFFNETLQLLETYNLSNKFLAITRWNVQKNGTLVEFSPEGKSQDVWIFQTPLPQFKNDKIKIGLLGCENVLAYQAQECGLTLLNPSLSIQCCHLHLSKVKTYSHTWPYAKMKKIGKLKKTTL